MKVIVSAAECALHEYFDVVDSAGAIHTLDHEHGAIVLDLPAHWYVALLSEELIAKPESAPAPSFETILETAKIDDSLDSNPY